MIQSALPFHEKRHADLEKIGFKINDCNPCVANKMVNGKPKQRSGPNTRIWGQKRS